MHCKYTFKWAPLWMCIKQVIRKYLFAAISKLLMWACHALVPCSNSSSRFNSLQHSLLSKLRIKNACQDSDNEHIAYKSSNELSAEHNKSGLKHGCHQKWSHFSLLNDHHVISLVSGGNSAIKSMLIVPQDPRYMVASSLYSHSCRLSRKV